MRFLFVFLICCLSAAAQAQNWNGVDSLYGFEWINYNKIYYKIKVADDGIYRVNAATLAAAGLNVAAGADLRLFRNGAPEPLYVSTETAFGSTDFVEFYGQKNRGENDRFLFANPEAQQLNPWYSMFNDTAVYFLVAAPELAPLRYSETPNVLDNLPAPEAYCWQLKTTTWADYSFKRSLSSEISYSWFDGNGFGTSPNTNGNYTITAPQRLTGGPAAALILRYASDRGQHQHKIFANDSLFFEHEFGAFGIVTDTILLKGNRLLASNTVRIQSQGWPDWVSVAGLSLRYPRLPDFDNAAFAQFELEPALGARYLEIKGINGAANGAILYDLNARQRFTAIFDNNLLKIKLPEAGNAGRSLALSANAGIKNVQQVEALQFRDLRNVQADYLIVSARALRKGNDPVQQYADYRKSIAGGGHSVEVVNVEELYDQFGYGGRFSPLGLRNFIQWTDRNAGKLEHVFIIGKALHYTEFRTAEKQQALADSLFFVPTFGISGSDLLFAMNTHYLSKPVAAVGRIAVTTPVQIRDYLNKVKEQEAAIDNPEQTLAARAWMKRVIHNSGGLQGEQIAIRSYTSSMRSALESNRFGAEVSSFYKTSNDPIQLSSYEQMLQLIDGGVAMWTIFGHSSPTAVDFDIGTVDVYNNKGRYPLMLVMGCFSGVCSTPQSGIGEQFTLAKDRGAIAYIASVNYGFIDALHTYGRRFYERIGGEDYGKSIGTTLNHVIEDYKNNGNPALISLLHQNFLQGDPAVRLYPHPGPDFLIDNSSIVVAPNPIGIQEERCTINFDLVNIGENAGGQLAYSVEQQLPNSNLIKRLLDTIPAPAFRKKMSIEVPVGASQVGFNRFFLTLDPQNVIAEKPALQAESNNQALDGDAHPGIPVYFFAEDVQPIYPPAYGVVGTDKVTLSFSTLNTAAPELRYRAEIDTSIAFNSPLKRQTSPIASGGLLEWTPDLTLSDSTVYYWRVARDTLIDGQIVWRNRSFIHLKGSAPGWNQSAYHQYRDGLFSNFNPVDSTRRIEFKDNAGFINIGVGYKDVNTNLGCQNSYYEGWYGDYDWNVQQVPRGVMAYISDPNTGLFVRNPVGGPHNYAPQAERFFYRFETADSLRRIALMEFIENEVPDGYYVGLLAFNNPNDPIGYAPQYWANDSVTYGKNLFQVLENQGAKDVRKLAAFTNTGPYPYGLVFRKNDPSYAAVDTFVTALDSTFFVRGNFLAKWSVGQMETPTAGPVKAWQKLFWKPGPSDNPSDEVNLELVGVRPDNLGDTVLAQLDANTLELSLANIDPQKYPRLKLRYDARDTLKRSAVQPEYLRLLYDALPEGGLRNPTYGGAFEFDTVQQGQPFRAVLAFKNVSDAAFDSVLVRFRIENANSGARVVEQRLAPLAPGETKFPELKLDTRDLQGPQRLVLDVNPDNDQAEQYHFNNVYVREFFVQGDKRNPALDVTFDGRHIMDGDIVSPKPEIYITLRDDNRYMAMSDTATFSLSVIAPDGSRQNLPYNSPDIIFIPANPTDLPAKNQARLEWRPTFTQDGEYQLLVNGKDAGGNESGVLDYVIKFRVITKTTLSNILNYPNPFSTSTCFVYTFTGLEQPRNFNIRIMTVSGKVVREIGAAEFGLLRAGTHVSDFCWDGKDQYGDQLANGVYLYRVIATDAEGKALEQFEQQSADGFFQAGYGKMVIMR